MSHDRSHTLPLEGRKALVTGGGRGIGRATAMALAARGADVVIVARSASEVEGTAREISALGVRGLPLVCDVTSDAAVDAMARDAASFGAIDILINGAGGAESAPVLRTGAKLWRETMATNLDSVHRVTIAFLGGMLERAFGRVVTIASRAGLEGFAYVSAYCAAKHGVIGFTRAVAREIDGTGVTINAVCPGYVDTRMTRRSADRIADATGVTREEALARLARFNPSGRLIAPDEVADRVVDLVVDEAGEVNGEAIPI